MSTTKSIVYIALFAAMIAIGAWITIPCVPSPFTLQTFFCMLAGGLLGAKKGTFSCLVYLAIGLVGLPVFTKGGGFQYVFQPTFGYLLGLVPACFLAGFLLKKWKIHRFLGVYALFFCCSVLILVCGYLYYLLIIQPAPDAYWATFVSLFLIFVPAELLKSTASAFLYQNLKKYFAQSE